MKKVYLLILFAFYATIGFAQIPSWLWAKPGAGSDYDWGSSVTADASGNVIATGYFSSATISFGSVTLTNSGFPVSSSDIFVVKYSPSGNVLWAKSIGGINNDLPFLLLQIQVITFILQDNFSALLLLLEQLPYSTLDLQILLS